MFQVTQPFEFVVPPEANLRIVPKIGSIAPAAVCRLHLQFAPPTDLREQYAPFAPFGGFVLALLVGYTASVPGPCVVAPAYGVGASGPSGRWPRQV